MTGANSHEFQTLSFASGFGRMSTSHIVIIIDYNEDTNEIAFSDRWGDGFKERWISIPEAEQISQQWFYVIDL